MKHSPLYNVIKQLYERGKLTQAQLEALVKQGKITQKEMEEIIAGGKGNEN